MPTMTAQNIIQRVLITLHEDMTSPVRWDKDKLLLALNDAQRQIVKFKPEAYVVTGAVATVAGSKQAIPDSGIQLIDIIRNMGTAGTTPGKVIRRCTRAELDEERPGWHTESPNAVAQNFVFDPRNPKSYYLYPSQPATSQGYVEMMYVAVPAGVVVSDWVSGSNVITLDDIYSVDIYHWILYVAYSQDATHSSNAARAMAYYQAFLQGLGVMDQAEANMSLPPTPTAMKI
ncbi:MAG: hypothetical protein RBT11_14175 [Desulfobacterales bacterium]|jgi:hypothetical protein|nr:hypothetical protein [Desulfobacterales bacterium]